MKKIKHFIFDFDGVVADTETVFADFDRKLLNEVLKSANTNHELTFADVRAMAGNSAEEKLSLTGKKFGIDLKAHENAFIEKRTPARKTLFRDNKVPLGKNLKEFLTLQKNKYALATNKLSDKLLPDMELMEIVSLFPIIITCEPPLKPKPAPDILLKAASELNASPEECAYVGDNQLDMQAAKAAGMMAIGFLIDDQNRTTQLQEAGADIVIDDFMNLKDYLS